MSTPQEILKEMMADAVVQTDICMKSYDQLTINIADLEEKITAIKDGMCDPTRESFIDYITTIKYEADEYVLCPGVNFGNCLIAAGNLTDWSVCAKRFDNNDPLAFQFKIISPKFFITPGNHVSMFVKHTGVSDIAFGTYSGGEYINVIDTNIDEAVLYDNDQSFPADVPVTVTIPLTFVSDYVTIQIPVHFKFYTFVDDSCPFMPSTYTTNIEIINNHDVSIEADYGSHTVIIPYTYIDATAGGPAFRFDLPVIQQTIIPDETKYIDHDIVEGQFPEIMADSLLSFNPDIYITPHGGIISEHYIEYESLYDIPSGVRGYVTRKTSDGRMITFGNGIYGIQPSADSKVEISAYSTLGALGNVSAGTITRGDNMFCTIGGITFLVDYVCVNNVPAENGYESVTTETQVTVTEEVIPECDAIFLWYAQYNQPIDATIDEFVYTWTFGQDYITRPISSSASYGLQDLIAKYTIAKNLQLNNANKYSESEDVFKPFT